MNELSQVFVFTKVVESGGFTAASLALNISPSAVSRQIAQLERHLGVRLLNRTTRKVLLTDVGAEFYEWCSRGLSCLNEAKDIAARYRETPLGRLRVSAPQGFGRHYIAKFMPEFLNLYPEIRVELSCSQLQKNIFDDGLDVMIQSVDLGDSSLLVRDLMPVELITCATPAYIARHGIPEIPKDLKRHNCLVYADPYTKNEWHYKSRDGEVAVRVSGDFETDSVDALHEAVMHGIGIARLPNYLIRDELRSGAVRMIFRDVLDADGAHLRTMMKAYYPNSKYQLPRVSVFINFLAERLNGLGD